MFALVYPEGTEDRSKRMNVVEPAACTFKFRLLPKLVVGCADATYASSLGVIWDQPETAAADTITKANNPRRHLPVQICTKALVSFDIFAPCCVSAAPSREMPSLVNPAGRSDFSPSSPFLTGFKIS
jgi:hypothetical protein